MSHAFPWPTYRTSLAIQPASQQVFFEFFCITGGLCWFYTHGCFLRMMAQAQNAQRQAYVDTAWAFIMTDNPIPP